MALLSTKDDAKSQPRLTRDDWIVSALEVLVEDGIEAVQITSLAKRLGVTRGSFYWHFANREQLLDALLREWRARNSDIMLEALITARSLTEGILNLFCVWVDHNRFDPKLDQAIRDWARRSTEVCDRVALEDDKRVEAIAVFYARHGYPDPESFIRARVIYFTQLSYYSLGIEEPLTKKMSYLAAYFRCFTGQDIDAAGAEAFHRRLLGDARTP